MLNNPEEFKKLLSEVIFSLQEQLVGERQAVAKAIAIQKLSQQGLLLPDYQSHDDRLLQKQTSLTMTLKQNLVALEMKLARFQALYKRFKDEGDDRPPSGGIAPSPRPKTPPPSFDMNDNAALPEQ